jgi:hypothetical protein
MNHFVVLMEARFFAIDNLAIRGLIYMCFEMSSRMLSECGAGNLAETGGQRHTNTDKGDCSSWLALSHTALTYPYGGSLGMLSPGLGRAPGSGVKAA